MKKYSGIQALSRLFRWNRKIFPPAPGKISTGDLGLAPLSVEFGYDRGGPVDRVYIEKFLQNESGSVKGTVLEIGDSAYTRRFGANKVQHSHILHIDDSNPQATIIADISDAPHIPDNSFDCIIMTQTLHLVYKFGDAVQTCHRILKPGGVLLLTVPGITPISHDQWQDTWYWSFTARSMTKMMEAYFQPANIEINTYGNVFIATAFLYGMGVKEVSEDQLLYNDPFYPVIVTVKSVKQ